MSTFYYQDGYLRLGAPKLLFNTDGKLALGEPWPPEHVRCVLDAHGQFRRRHELRRCAICGLWWDLFEMSRAGGNSRQHGRGSYCQTCNRNYLAWRREQEALSHRRRIEHVKTVPRFRYLYLKGELHVKPPAQQYPDNSSQPPT